MHRFPTSGTPPEASGRGLVKVRALHALVLAGRRAAQPLHQLPGDLVGLDQTFGRIGRLSEADRQTALGAERNGDVEMPRLDVAPEPLVRLVADAEIIEGYAVVAGFADVLEEQKLTGTG